jgi:hypothetical protein
MDEWPPVAGSGPRRGSAKNGAGSFQSETDPVPVARRLRWGRHAKKPGLLLPLAPEAAKEGLQCVDRLSGENSPLHFIAMVQPGILAYLKQ